MKALRVNGLFGVAGVADAAGSEARGELLDVAEAGDVDDLDAAGDVGGFAAEGGEDLGRVGEL